MEETSQSEGLCVFVNFYLAGKKKKEKK